MPIDAFKPAGPAKMAKPTAGGGNNKNVPLIGVVKDNIDPTRSGRIKVALQSGKGAQEPDSSDSWVTVQYLSTFFGAVNGTSGSNAEDYGTYKSNPSSYGQWQAPPDIGTKVVCLFINGDPNYGFYIGCIPEPEKLQMVPAIGASDKVTLNPNEANSYGGSTRLPVTNLNTNNTDKANSNQFLETARPVHSYTATIMNQQGIIRDPVRGPISSSASREPASRVGWGVSTPGRPIYSGGYDDTTLPENLKQSKSQQLQVVARRGGHSIVMDDGDIIGRDQLIRIRTALGHQILMSDDGQTLMILHSNGQSYIELGKEGTVDIYSTNSFNVRTQGDINFHADRDINFHAAEKLNFQAKNIHSNSDEITKFRAGSSYQIHTPSTFSVKAKTVAMSKGGMLSSLVTGISKAFTLTKPPVAARPILDSALASITSSPPVVPKLTLIKQTDTLYDEEKGWAAAPEKLTSITSRAPAHAPWANAGLGINVKTSLSASGKLPSSPSNAVQQTVQAGKATGIAPPAVATVMSSPATSPVSASVDSSATNAVISATATAAAKGATSKAVAQGAAIIGVIGDTIGNKNNATVAAGMFGQTISQLETAGVVKPGAERLINGLVSAGVKINNAVSDTLFTGKPGAESLLNFVTNVETQASSMVTTLRQAQTALTNLGVMSGKEDATQTSGIVVAAATTGVKNTIDTIKTAATTFNATVSQFNNNLNNENTLTRNTSPSSAFAPIINQFQGATPSSSTVLGASSVVLSAIGSGGAAAGLSSSLSGVSGIINSVNSLFGKNPSTTTGSDKGTSASAFYTIINSFPKLKANVPQVLSQIAKDAAGTTAGIASAPAIQLQGRNLSSLASTIGDVFNTANSLSSEFVDQPNPILGDRTVENTITGITGISNALNTFNSLTKTSTTATSGTNATTDLGKLINTVSGVSQITNLVNSFSGSKTTNNEIINTINQVSSLAGAGQALISGGLSGLTNAAKSTQAGSSAAQASALASGVYYFPGGLKSFSSIVDNKTVSSLVSGLGGLSKLIGNNQTAIQNGLGKAINTVNDINKIATQVDGLTTKVSGVLNISPAGGIGEIAGIANLSSLPIGDVSKKLGGITSALSSKLSIGGASDLLSSMGSLFGGGDDGPAPTKLPEIGFNTFDRILLTARIISNLNDPGIPAPNLLGSTKTESSNKLISVEKPAQELEESKAKVSAAIDQNSKYKAEYYRLRDSLGENDPATIAAFNEWSDSTQKLGQSVKSQESAFANTLNASAGQYNTNINTMTPEQLIKSAGKT